MVVKSMCGRYRLFTSEEYKEINRIVKEIEQNQNITVKNGEIYPTNVAPVVIMQNNKLIPKGMLWGFPKSWEKGVVINARSETALEKKMFATSLTERRCLIPSTGFFEWQTHSDKNKTKNLFNLKDSELLYMAGIYNSYKKNDGTYEDRFCILTTKANQWMEKVHHRMPVVLNPNEHNNWLESSSFGSFFDRGKIELIHLPV